MSRVLLHICCGVCAFASIQKLKQDGFIVCGFFFNPNIYPYPEYEKRLNTARKVCAELDITLEEGGYFSSQWFNFHQQYRQEKEGQKRCQLCYQWRLKETFNFCCRKNYDYFATTLSISPHKQAKVINEIGKSISADKFLACDFKKDDGFRKSIAAAKELNLYRQNYCGCIYSRGEACPRPQS